MRLSGSIRMMFAALPAISRALGALLKAGWARSAAPASACLSKPRTAWPAASRLAAIGTPIMPNPMKPIA